MNFKVGDRVFIPKLQQSGEIFAAREYNNPYTQETFYSVILDSDNNCKKKSKNPSVHFREYYLQFDSKRTIQLSLL
jgi:hypothetical protein